MKKSSKILLFSFLLILPFTLFWKSNLLGIGFGFNVPIDFYGRVVDETGKSLPGVTLSYRIQQTRLPWDSHSVVGEVTTDSQGAFVITGKRGSSLGFEEFKKKGYRKTGGQDLSYVYTDSSNRFVPERTQPIVFTMISEHKIERLVKEGSTMQLKWGGVPVFYDVNTGKFGENGEIEITARRGQAVGKGREARFDWSIKIEVPGGGVIETTRAETYLAPERGYRSAWEFGYLASDPDWGGGRRGETYLFFKLKNENYGYLHLNFDAYPKRKVSGRISSYFNHSGGRVLVE